MIVEAEEKLSALKALQPSLVAAQKHAQEAVDNSQLGKDAKQTFQEFKLNYPAEYGQITLLCDVNCVVGQAAHWTNSVNTDVEILEGLLEELADRVSDCPDPNFLLPLVD